LNAAVANAFDTGVRTRTRSVIVIHKDRIIAEKYDMGFKDSKILGWSMTKALRPPFWNTGKKGKYDIYKPAPIAEWQQDKRKILQQMICFT
jgi:hypothetical protein